MRVKQHPSKKGRIEIIPMIDVVFFLLVFSMLSALTMAEIRTLESDVPRTGSGMGGEVNRITANNIKGQLFLTIETRDVKEQVKLQRAEQATAIIQKHFQKNRDIVVLVNATDTLDFGEGAALLDAVRQVDPDGPEGPAGPPPMVVPAGEG